MALEITDANFEELVSKSEKAIASTRTTPPRPPREVSASS